MTSSNAITARRIMGSEVEYGITGDGPEASRAIALSTAVVAAYAKAQESQPRWDYAHEDPLSDARGFHLPRAAADASQLTNEVDPAELTHDQDTTGTTAGTTTGAAASTGTHLLRALPRPSQAEENRPRPANTVLSTGGRLYVDHAHPEYSTPEVTDARQAVLAERAGDVIVTRAMELAQRSGTPDVGLWKNNVDGKGASYGCHENYLVSRELDFSDIVDYLTTFLVTRQILCGSGRVGLGPYSTEAGFQISQRADYIENTVGLETTFNRPIINTRDEPHAASHKYRRLHVIIGDANLFDTSIYLRMGTTSLLLSLLEKRGAPMDLDALALADPVQAIWQISHDPTLQRTVKTKSERSLTALQIQRAYYQLLHDAAYEEGTPDPDTTHLLATWDRVLTMLETDIASAAADVEWVAKYQLLQAMRARHQLSWDDPQIQAVDLQWHDLRPERSLVARLDKAGRVNRMFVPDDVLDATERPPAGTRAYLRGELVRHLGPRLISAGWAAVTVDDPASEHRLRLLLPDPHRGTKAEVERIIITTASREPGGPERCLGALAKAITAD